MQKISGILPSTPRVAAVDLKSSLPVRPGTPTFGQQVGETTQDRYSKSKAHLGIDVHQLNNDNRYRDSKEAKRVSIAERIADRFFMEKAAQMEQPEKQPIETGSGVVDEGYVDSHADVDVNQNISAVKSYDSDGVSVREDRGIRIGDMMDVEA